MFQEIGKWIDNRVAEIEKAVKPYVWNRAKMLVPREDGTLELRKVWFRVENGETILR